MPIDKMMKRKLVLICIIIFSVLVFSQENEDGNKSLPSGFHDTVLGLSLEDLKAALYNHPYLNYRGDPDVSLLSQSEEKLIQCEGTGYVSRGIFQLRNNSLYLMSFILDTEKIDYYSMYVNFTDKYGEPDSLSPSEAVWENENVRMSLEKPLTVKYLDLNTFNEIIESSKKQESLYAKERADFLEGF